jgi:hypothetical protein
MSRRRRQQRAQTANDTERAREHDRAEMKRLMGHEPTDIDWDTEMDHEQDESCIGGADEWDKTEKRIAKEHAQRMAHYKRTKADGRGEFDDGWSDDD